MASPSQILWCKDLSFCKDVPCVLHVEETGDLMLSSAVGDKVAIKLIPKSEHVKMGELFLRALTVGP